MKRKILTLVQYTLLALAVALWPCAARSAESFDDSAVKHVAYPDWFMDSPFHDLQEAVDGARSSGKRGLMVLFTTEGCSYCEAFIRNSLGDPAIAASVQQHFHALGLEIFDDAEMLDPRGATLAVKQFADNSGAEFAPTLLFIDTTGETVLRVVGYQSPERFMVILDYVAGEHYRTVSLRDYFSQQATRTSRPTPGSGLHADPLFGKPPYQLDRSRIAAQRPLLLIFEEADCSACTDFHTEVLAAADVREMLGQFEVVRFDAADATTPVIAPDGRRTNPAALFREFAFTRAPALVFFDTKGNAVLKTDALVLHQRMMNSLSYVHERAYEKGMTYQRFARSKGLEKRRNAQ